MSKQEILEMINELFDNCMLTCDEKDKLINRVEERKEKEESKTYTYFVSYQIQYLNSWGIGCTTVERNRKIKTADDIFGINKDLLEVNKEKNPTTTNIILMNYKLLEE